MFTSRELKPLISHLNETRTCVFFSYIHSINHMYLYSRDDRKIKFRMVSAQHFINEAPSVANLVTLGLIYKTCIRTSVVTIRALNRFKERKRKPETKKILTGTEPETKSNFIVPNRIKKLKWPLTG